MRRVVDHVEGARAPDERVKYWVATNGTLITEEVVDFLAAHDFKILLSFDGTREAQAFRGEDTFEKLDRVLDTLRETHPDYFRRAFEISATVPPDAVPFLAGLGRLPVREGRGGDRLDARHDAKSGLERRPASRAGIAVRANPR